eukprot:scaffold564_cov248-Pinguiococcus_pyrenoidosus.AAC.13
MCFAQRGGGDHAKCLTARLLPSGYAVKEDLLSAAASECAFSESRTGVPVEVPTISLKSKENHSSSKQRRWQSLKEDEDFSKAPTLPLARDAALPACLSLASLGVGDRTGLASHRHPRAPPCPVSALSHPRWFLLVKTSPRLLKLVPPQASQQAKPSQAKQSIKEPSQPYPSVPAQCIGLETPIAARYARTPSSGRAAAPGSRKDMQLVNRDEKQPAQQREWRHSDLADCPCGQA